MIILLILFDQSIKIIISNNLMNKEFFILGDIVMFKPHLNTKYSWFNSLTNMGIGLLPHLILNIAVILFSLIAFDFIINRYKDNTLVRCLFTFLYAGIFCSLIDKVFWGGSLDYIRLKGFFIFDLKDIYVSIFQAILIFTAIFNYKRFKKIDEKVIFNEFKTYIKLKYLSKNI